MRLHWLVSSLIALALGVLQTRSVRAESEPSSSTAVLGLEGFDVPISLTDDMSEQLRQRVSAAHDMRLVSGKDLVEVKLVFGCADEAASCMAQAGKSLDAQKLIYGSVKRSGDDYAVWLKMFDVRRAKIEFWLTETLPRKNADGAGVKAAAGRWFAKLTGRNANVGVLQISANVPGATVSLDGVPAGTTADQPLTIADVAVGRHELVIAKQGRTSARQHLELTAGQTLTVSVTLAAAQSEASLKTVSPVAAPAGPAADAEKMPPPETIVRSGSDSDGRSGYRTGFWVTLVAGLASAGAAVKFGLDVSDINTKLDPYRRFPCMGNQLCDSKGVVRPALTATEKTNVSSLNDEGSRDQTLQWVCVGVGAALGVASGYLLYKGYIDSDDDSGHAHAHQGLRVFPAASGSSGGIVAEFEF